MLLSFINKSKIYAFTEKLNKITDKLRFSDVISQDRLSEIKTSIIDLYKRTIEEPGTVNIKEGFQANMGYIVKSMVLDLRDNVNEIIPRHLFRPI